MKGFALHLTMLLWYVSESVVYTWNLSKNTMTFRENVLKSELTHCAPGDPTKHFLYSHKIYCNQLQYKNKRSMEMHNNHKTYT